MKKGIFIFLIWLGFLYPVFGHEFDGHQNELSKVLFGKDYRLLSGNESQNFFILSNSIYLVIDAFNGNGQKQLGWLKEQGVKKLPDLKDFDYRSSPNQHQYYTHRGWNKIYKPDNAHWETRKQILRNSVERVFEKNSQNEAICEFIYYMHILGDHEGDAKVNSKTRIALGGSADNYDILSIMGKQIIPKLFNNSHGLTLSQKLFLINEKIDKLLRTNQNNSGPRRSVEMLTDEEYKKYQNFAAETINLLAETVPLLLQFNPWFVKAFPSIIKQ